MITAATYYGANKPTLEIEANAQRLLTRVNALLAQYGKPVTMSSGLRSAAHNATIKGAAKRSAHLTGEAIDLSDRNRDLARFCFSRLDLLVDLGLWMEDPRCTPTWVHLDIRQRANRVFIPDANWAARLAGQPLTATSIKR